MPGDVNLEGSPFKGNLPVETSFKTCYENHNQKPGTYILENKNWELK